MIYLDTSVALAQLLAEDRYPPASLWGEPLVSSRLLEYEVWTWIHAQGLDRSHGEGVRLLLGRLAFLELKPQENFDIWMLPLEEVESDHPKAGKPEPFLETPFSEWGPIISPDGRWVAYESDESGNNEVYVRRFSGPGGKWQISTDGGELGPRWTPSAARRNPVWSRTRQELFYRSRQGIMVVSYAGQGEVFAAGRPRLWAEKKDLGEFDIAPDGKRFAAIQPASTADQSGPTKAMVLLNFFDELRQRAPVGNR